MHRSTAALLLAGCLTLQGWAQTPPTQQPPATEKASTAPSSSTEYTQFPLDKFKEFSAIMAGGPVPGTENEIHIYRSGNLMRMEGPGSKSYQITDLITQETHGIAAASCLRMKVPFVRSYPFSFSSPANKFQRIPVGKETVDGHVCQVEDILVTLPNKPDPAKFRLWEAEDLGGFPVKIETRLHRAIQYKNVVLGPQDPTLFIFPEQCMSDDEIGSGAPKSGKPAPKPHKSPPPKPQ